MIDRRDVETVRARVLNMLLCDFTATASVHSFSGNDTCDMALAVPPIRVGTATDAGGGVVHVTKREVNMLRGVELERCWTGERPARANQASKNATSACHLNGQAGLSRIGREREKQGRAERSRAEVSRAELRC